MALELRAALEADVWRYDASDTMPTSIGAFKDDFSLGWFFHGMLDWVDGIRTIDEVFADIDDAWAVLKAEGRG